MAMNKKEQAAVAEMQRELKLHELCQLRPVPKPDVPPPLPGSGAHAMGWSYNPHSASVYKAVSSSIGHKLGSHEINDRCGWGQRPMSLYSTRELALEAMKAAFVRKHMGKLLDEIERMEEY